MGYPGGLFNPRRLNLKITESNHYKLEALVVSFSLPVNMPFCLALLERVFAGLPEVMSTQANHFVKEKAILIIWASIFTTLVVDFLN